MHLCRVAIAVCLIWFGCCVVIGKALLAEPTVTNDVYPMYGTDYYSLLTSRQKETVKKFSANWDGLTSWDYNYRIQFKYNRPLTRGGARVCNIANITVTLSLTVTLPKWMDRDKTYGTPPAFACCQCTNNNDPQTCYCTQSSGKSAPGCIPLRPEDVGSGLRSRWDNFYEKLQKHEGTHVNYGKSLASELNQKLENLPSKSSCQELQADAERTVREVDEKWSKINAQYDIDTNHGKNEGLIL